MVLMNDMAGSQRRRRLTHSLLPVQPPTRNQAGLGKEATGPVGMAPTL